MKLLPCPFCGGNARKSVGTYGDGSDWRYIECESCSVMCDPNAWNLRSYSGYAKGQSDMRKRAEMVCDSHADTMMGVADAREFQNKPTIISRSKQAAAEFLRDKIRALPIKDE